MNNSCQLACAYCYAEAGNHPRLQMSEEVGAAAIVRTATLVREHGGDSFGVHFHSFGEPTLSWTLMQRLWHVAKRTAAEMHLEARTTVASNAVWSEGQVRWIADHIDGITLSIDGAPDIQTRNGH